MVGLPKRIIKKYGVSKKAWSVFRGEKQARGRRGGSMARKKKSGGRRGGGFGSRAILPVGGIIGSALLGLGAAAVAKRFIGAPLGTYTGAAAGFAVGGLGGALGGFVHDNIGNIGGARASSSSGGAP